MHGFDGKRPENIRVDNLMVSDIYGMQKGASLPNFIHNNVGGTPNTSRRKLGDLAAQPRAGDGNLTSRNKAIPSTMRSLESKEFKRSFVRTSLRKSLNKQPRHG